MGPALAEVKALSLWMFSRVAILVSRFFMPERDTIGKGEIVWQY